MWLCMYFKRLFKMPFFVVIMLLLPLCAYLSAYAQKNSDERLNVGLFFENGEYCEPITGKLKEASDLFEYVVYDDTDKLRNDVAGEKLHCGYIFKTDFDAEELSEKSITCIKTDNSILSGVSEELVFSAIQDVYGYAPAENYRDEENFDKITDEEIEKKYAYYIASDLTYSFVYEMIGEGYSREITDNDDKATMFPIRAIGALIIMLSAVFGAVRFESDETKGLHKRLSPDKRFFAAVLNIFSMVFTAAVSTELSVILAGSFTQIGIEIISLALYIVIAVLFGVVIAFLSASLAVSLTPILVIGTIIFCPVFVDAQMYLPFAGIVNKLFIPYYYISIYSGKSILQGVAAMLVLSIFAFSLFMKENE